MVGAKDIRFAYKVCLKSKEMFEKSLKTPNRELNEGVLKRLKEKFELIYCLKRKS